MAVSFHVYFITSTNPLFKFQLPDPTGQMETHLARKSSGRLMSRKRSHIEATSREEGLDEEDYSDRSVASSSVRLHQLLKPSPSFKVDDDPQIVRHLVQTLGLIGTGDSLDMGTLKGSQQLKTAGSVASGLGVEMPTKERHNSLV